MIDCTRFILYAAQREAEQVENAIFESVANGNKNPVIGVDSSGTTVIYDEASEISESTWDGWDGMPVEWSTGLSDPVSKDENTQVSFEDFVKELSLKDDLTDIQKEFVEEYT